MSALIHNPSLKSCAPLRGGMQLEQSQLLHPSLIFLQNPSAVSLSKENQQSVIQAMLNHYSQAQPIAGKDYWATRVWTLITWQPIYLSVYGVHVMKKPLNLSALQQRVELGVIYGYGFQGSAFEDEDSHNPQMTLAIMAQRLKQMMDDSFESLWPKICVSHYAGEDSSQYLIERSLMRPRFLLNLISQCKSFAINLNHDRVLEEDIEKGLTAYSTDLLTDIGYEIHDVENNVDDILYAFIGSKSVVKKGEVFKVLVDFGVDEQFLEKIFELLFWYGFIGLIINDEPKYIYDFHYSMKLMAGIIKKKGDIEYLINPAFWPALMIDSH